MAKGRKFGIVALVIVALVAVLIWRVAANLDGIVAGIIEDTGTEVLGTQVSVSGVSIDLGAGKAGIGGLSIANPEGFSRGSAFELRGIAVELQLSSLTEDVIVIKAIQVAEPRVAFETK
jgi:hypothetical protein